MFDESAVADPYYGDLNDFYAMFEHIQKASNSWLDKWTMVQKND